MEGKSSTLSQQIKLEEMEEKKRNGKAMLVADRRFSDICICRQFLCQRGFQEDANGVSCCI